MSKRMLTTRVPEDLYLAFQDICRGTGMSMNQVVVLLLSNYVQSVNTEEE